jgi:hypothetical protein
MNVLHLLFSSHEIRFAYTINSAIVDLDYRIQCIDNKTKD